MNRTKPSWQHQAIVGVMKLLKVNKTTAEGKRQSVRRRDDKWTPPQPPKKIQKTLRVSRHSERGWPVWKISPAAPAASRGAVVAVHGGGYTTELLSPHWSFYASLARDGGVDVIVPIYPLAPRGTAAAVVPVVADLVAEQISWCGAADVAVVGDSAGAGLLMAAVQELVTRGDEVPSRMVLISPWLDVTISDPRSTTIDDPFCSFEGLREAGRMWAGDLDPADPRVSPVNGSIDGLPATWVYAGLRDILSPDALRLQERATAEHAPFAFDVREGLIHGWAGFPFIPEGKEVTPRILQQLTDPSVPTPTAK